MRGLAIAFSVGLILTGCATGDSYAPDPTLTASTGATLVGSRQDNPNPLVADMRTIVSVVDGKPTRATVFDWGKSILLAPGTHTIQLYSRLGRSGGGVVARMEFEAGKAYALRAERHGLYQATVWLEETSSHQVIGEKLAVCLSPDAPILQLFSSCK